MSQRLGLEEALDIAMDAELKAQAFYAQAAVEVQEPHGRDLLGRLAAFEQYHYQKLSELARSLQVGGSFIDYETRTVDQFVPLLGQGEAMRTDDVRRTEDVRRTDDVRRTLLDELRDVPGILNRAITNEKIAGERYRALAEATGDPAGQDMFRKLAHEETIHQRILEDEFFSVSNRGVWGWSGMYGE